MIFFELYLFAEKLYYHYYYYYCCCYYYYTVQIISGQRTEKM